MDPFHFVSGDLFGYGAGLLVWCGASGLASVSLPKVPQLERQKLPTTHTKALPKALPFPEANHRCSKNG